MGINLEDIIGQFVGILCKVGWLKFFDELEIFQLQF
jgi:hypothetical protein